MAHMTRHRGSIWSAAVACAATLAVPGAASAKITEIGALPGGVRGGCPENCQAVSRTTGYQAKVGPDRALYQAPADGRIVAWTIALGKPGPKQTAFFTERLGGEAQAALVVLAPDKKLSRQVVAKAPLQTLTDYFGTIVQFPLERTLPVKKGQYIGLTVPSWAPALQIGLGSDTSWRASRPADSCVAGPAQTALVGTRGSAKFACLFRTARLTYSATFIPTPTKDSAPAKDATAPTRTAPAPKKATRPKKTTSSKKTTPAPKKASPRKQTSPAPAKTTPG
jgi:hypothetical protein